MILDGGPTAHGIESTVLDATGDKVALLRPGAVPADVIETVLGEKLLRPASDRRTTGVARVSSRATMRRTPACDSTRAM